CVIDLGATVGSEGEFAGVVDDAGLLQLFFGFTDGGDFRIGVNHVGDHVVVYVAGLPGENFCHGDALVFRLVRQHRPGDDVADGEDAWDIRRVTLVDDNTAALVLLHADVFEAEPLRIGHAADGNQNDIG